MELPLNVMMTEIMAMKDCTNFFYPIFLIHSTRLFIQRIIVKLEFLLIQPLHEIHVWEIEFLFITYFRNVSDR
jgi:hypothetical protein